jgi:hypothetical protein
LFAGKGVLPNVTRNDFEQAVEIARRFARHSRRPDFQVDTFSKNGNQKPLRELVRINFRGSSMMSIRIAPDLVREAEQKVQELGVPAITVPNLLRRLNADHIDHSQELSGENVFVRVSEKEPA